VTTKAQPLSVGLVRSQSLARSDKLIAGYDTGAVSMQSSNDLRVKVNPMQSSSSWVWMVKREFFHIFRAKLNPCHGQ
jgi:hypothetical protein